MAGDTGMPTESFEVRPKKLWTVTAAPNAHAT